MILYFFPSQVRVQHSIPMIGLKIVPNLQQNVEHNKTHNCPTPHLDQMVRRFSVSSLLSTIEGLIKYTLAAGY